MIFAVSVYEDILVDKHPGATLDYSLDWTEWLDDDTIADSTWSVPVGITKGSDSFSTTKATIWLSGGTEKIKYRAVNTVTTAQGRTESKSIKIKIITIGG